MASGRFWKVILGTLAVLFAVAFAAVGIKSFTVGGFKIYFVFAFLPIVLLSPAGISCLLRRFSRSKRDKFAQDDLRRP
jgi:multisubunit Na+/H+ antiporter MnhG subunit